MNRETNSIEEREPLTFENELQILINKHSKENDSDTPDFALAEYLNNCLLAYNTAVKSRDKYFGVDMWSSDKIAQASVATGIEQGTKS